MKVDNKLLLKVLSPRLISKAVAAFDRSTIIVVGSCWAAALFMVTFALYTLHLSAATRHAAEEVEVAEPSLPKIVRERMDAHDAEKLIDRLQHLYPDVTFAYRGSLTVLASDGGKFREWLSALGYIDTISPQYHWAISDLCVGNCNSHDLMKATLMGEKISFQKPQQEIKD